MSFAEDYELYKQNMLPCMYEVLAEDLGCKVSSLQELGVGFYPANQVWTFAERNHKGEIIGLSYRSMNGKKWMAEGSKRGLIYAYNVEIPIGETDKDKEGRHEPTGCEWVQIHRTGLTCPICGHEDWCRVSSDYEDPSGPSEVACSRTEAGSIREIAPDGHLHILDPNRSGRGVSRTNKSVLCETELPILIVEGASDVLAAMDLGFVAIGRPSAKGGMEELKQMPIAGKEIWIIGERDAGVGKAGMEKTLLNLEFLSDKILCVMPPEGVKDLRQWVHSGLTQESLTTYVKEHGQSNLDDSNIFPDDIAQTIAKCFLDRYRTDDGQQTLRSYHGNWTIWRNGIYDRIEQSDFRGTLYRFLENKSFVKPIKTGIDVAKYKPTRSKVTDIIDALSGYCPVPGTPPSWIDQKDRPDIQNLIAFKNGLLDINAFFKEKIVLLEPTPDLFTYATLPYDYDPESWSDLFTEYCDMTFNANDECVRLLAQWMGYNIVFDTCYEKFMMFIGQKRSGKSTITSAMEAMLGPTQCGSTSLSMLANTHGLNMLVGKSTVIAGDIKGTLRRAEMDAALEVILRITGRDRIPINPKFVEPYDIELPCRFTMAMNDLPAFTDHSQAIVARTLILPFPNCYVGREDFTLKDRIKKDAADGKLINFALWGLKDLREQGRFTEPKISADQISQFTTLTAPMTAFLDECCILDSGAEIQKDQLYDAWKGWCISCDRKQGNKMLFNRWLNQYAPTLKDENREINNEQIRMCHGITLKSWCYLKFLGRPE